MNRVYLPLLPLPVLAAIVAASACSRPRTEETPHVIPPAMALEATPAAAPPPTGAVVAGASAAPATASAEEDRPTAEDVKEFGRKVSK